MTVIAGITHRGRVYLAGDASVSWGDGGTCQSLRKVRRCGGILLGACGDKALADLVLTGRWCPRWDGSSPGPWLTDVLAPALRSRTRGVRGDLGLLLGIGGQLWAMGRDGGAHDWATPYAAVGSGADVALGALHESAMGRPVLAPATRLRRALRAAEEHCASVVGPWAMVSG